MRYEIREITKDVLFAVIDRVDRVAVALVHSLESADKIIDNLNKEEVNICNL